MPRGDINHQIKLPTRLSVFQAALFLGMHVKTLRNNMYRRPAALPRWYKVGSKLVFDLDELKQWMATRRSDAVRDQVIAGEARG
jgi:hypothetical protein